MDALTDDSPAVQFFFEHAGYATPPGRTASALASARAEAWLLAQPDLAFVTEHDDETAYCHCDDPQCRYGEHSTHTWPTIYARIVRLCPDHGIQCRHTTTLASLAGIIDPDDAYLRVVRAELAREAQPTESRTT